MTSRQPRPGKAQKVATEPLTDQRLKTRFQGKTDEEVGKEDSVAALLELVRRHQVWAKQNAAALKRKRAQARAAASPPAA